MVATSAEPAPDAFVTLLLGSPESRVEAAWAIGLVHGRRAAPVFERRARTEPHPGVRRHLAVVLAGVGAEAAVVRLARHDPDPRVRATAVSQLARLCTPARRDLFDLLGQHLHDAAPAVRAAAVRSLPDEAPRALWAQLGARLEDPEPTVRRAALERLEGAPGRHPGLEALADRRADVDPDPTMQRILRRFQRSRGRRDPAPAPRGVRYPLLVLATP